MSDRNKAYLALLLTALIWGLASPIIKYSLKFTSPLSFLFYRFLIVSCIFIIPLLIRIKKIKPKLDEIIKYLTMGFLGAPLTLFLLFSGLSRTQAVSASIISLFTPVLIVLGGFLLLKEKVEKREKKGIFLILIGVSLNIIEPLFRKSVNTENNLLGNVLIFLGSLSWVTFSLWRRKEGGNLDSFFLSAVSFLLGLFFLLPYFLIHRSLFTVHPNAIPGILYMSILGSVVAYFTYIYGFSKIEASEATLFTYLEPIFAIPTAIIFLKEKISPLFLLSAIIIVFGIFVANLRQTFPQKRQKRESIELKGSFKV